LYIGRPHLHQVLIPSTPPIRGVPGMTIRADTSTILHRRHLHTADVARNLRLRNPTTTTVVPSSTAGVIILVGRDLKTPTPTAWRPRIAHLGIAQLCDLVHVAGVVIVLVHIDVYLPPKQVLPNAL
jgi:hypothetical protein